jgi:hypothetical protein
MHQGRRHMEGEQYAAKAKGEKKGGETGGDVEGGESEGGSSTKLSRLMQPDREHDCDNGQAEQQGVEG